MSATDEATEILAPFPEEPPSTTPAGVQSIFDQLRAQREQLAGEHHLDLAVPGWGGRLLLRMGPVDPRRFKAIMAQARNTDNPDPEQVERMNADLIIQATQSVLYQGPDGEMVLADDDGPIGLDQRLADGLGLRAGTAREVVLALFDKANDRLFALGAFTQKWIEWAQSADEEVDEAFVGESSSTRPS